MDSKAAMLNWDDFHARARRVIPKRKLKPRCCFIGVLNHEKNPQAYLEETDLVWMMGHKKILIETIHETYQKRHENLDFQLKFKDGVVDKSDTIKSFWAPHDDLVLFLACSLDQPLSQTQSSAQRLPDTKSQNNVESATMMSDVPLRSPSFAECTKEESSDNNNMSFPQTQRMAPSMTTIAPDIKSETVSVWGMVQNVRRSPLMGSISRTSENMPQQSTSTVAACEISVNEVQPVANAPQQSNSELFNTTQSKDVQYAPFAKQVRPLTPGHLATLINMENNDEKVSCSLPRHMAEDRQAPFDPEKFFNRELYLENDSQEDVQTTDRSIREIIALQDPRILEAGVAQSMKVLQTLKLSFSRYTETNQDALAWTEAIDKLIPQARRKRTIVGVVGNTGAGKSSVINAMLDEERLVPTNCMRACTAVVTEMSWNDSRDPSSKYRAEIEFISHDDWKKEVATLIKEFLTESGAISRDAADENSDAGIAWAKFHSVYPRKTRDSLSDCTVESLMSDKTVLAVLGTTKMITTASPTAFYWQLQRYVDSKEKISKKGKEKQKDNHKNVFDMEHWPLIKVVKIYVKAPALSTGAVIVDLPGLHDSNAARAAVAQGYMKQCTGLWIIAPINRAVDDKAAKTLLGESFKRQLKYDGSFSSVTFICSKTDDISITEAVETLELNDEVDGLYNQQGHYKQEIEAIKVTLEDLRDAQAVYKATQAEASSDMEIWERLRERLDEGKPAYTPRSKSNKRRKLHLKQTEVHKKRRTDFDDSDDDFIVTDEEDALSKSDDDSGDEDVWGPGNRLTEDDIKIKLKELREAKRGARRNGLENLEKMTELKTRSRDIKAEIATIQAEISHICIAGRNDYSKRAIQQDFAAGLKELDQENAAEEDEDNFNPDEELRDYDKVAKSLPVFCVSSRAYQKMSGRLQKDDAVPGFKTPEETEMPQLQAHCRKLTEAGRIQTARTFLLSLCQQLTTFSLWASDDGTGHKMTGDDRRKQARYLEKRLSELERGLEEAVRACLNVMKKEMNDQIFDKYPDLITEAINAAPDTAQKWGAHRNEGGLLWATYKAVVRRDGQYESSSAGHRDFNADLVSPIVKKLATGWERAFQNKLPRAFESFVTDSGKLLHSFHQAVEERARNSGVGLASLAALKTQIYTHEQLFANLNQVLITKMTELQREANRDFTPTIANIMHTVYDICANEHGAGSFKRMKFHMSSYIDQCRQHMFNDATLTVKRHLDAMCKALEEVMEENAAKIYVKMKTDYMRVLGGLQIEMDQTAHMPKNERTLRSEVVDILRSVDAQFEPIARGEIVDQSIVEVADAAIDESITVDEDNDSRFESPRKLANRGDNKNSFTGANNDTMIIEPTPLKHSTANVDMEICSDNENRRASTLIDHGINQEET